MVLLGKLKGLSFFLELFGVEVVDLVEEVNASLSPNRTLNDDEVIDLRVMRHLV